MFFNQELTEQRVLSQLTWRRLGLMAFLALTVPSKAAPAPPDPASPPVKDDFQQGQEALAAKRYEAAITFLRQFLAESDRHEGNPAGR